MTTVIVFAKAPVAGTVKTRLAARLGPEGAARVHAELVEHTLATVTRASLGPVELCCAPDAGHGFFDACRRRFGVTLTEQGDGDLGARMHRALARACASGPALLVGTDCPVLDADHLRSARVALASADVVIGPAEDGGYVLVGARGAVDPRMFEGIAWGGPEVLTTTRERIADAGIRHAEIGTLWDIDLPADYDRWRRLEGGSA